MVVDSKRTLRSLHTRNWELGQKKVLALETSGDKTRKTTQDATDSFVRDAEARGLRAPSVYKYKLLFKQLNAFAEDKGFVHVDELDLDALRSFRESWKNKNYSAKKKWKHSGRSFVSRMTQGGSKRIMRSRSSRQRRNSRRRCRSLARSSNELFVPVTSIPVPSTPTRDLDRG